MAKLVTILAPGFADWETALLNAAARGYYGLDTHFATPGGTPVVSSGGMQVTPDMAVEDIDADDIDALIVCGGSAWTGENAPDVSKALREARDAGKTVAAICDGTLALARAGLLDDVEHTSNSPDNLPPSGYKGAEHYKDQPQAVVDGRIVTAPGTAPVSFMRGVMRTLGFENDELKFYAGLYAKEHMGTAT